MVFCHEFCSRRVYAFFVLFFGAKNALVLIFTLLECLWSASSRQVLIQCKYFSMNHPLEYVCRAAI